MKKIALFLVFIMIFGCCFALTSCFGNSNDVKKEKTLEEKAQEKVEDAMGSRMSLGMTLTNGSKISFVSCTFATTTDLGNNNFEISGTVKVRDQYGSFWVANYDTEVKYNSDSGDYYYPTINYGTFYKQ